MDNLTTLERYELKKCLVTLLNTKKLISMLISESSKNSNHSSIGYISFYLDEWKEFKFLEVELGDTQIGFALEFNKLPLNNDLKTKIYDECFKMENFQEMCYTLTWKDRKLYKDSFVNTRLNTQYVNYYCEKED